MISTFTESSLRQLLGELSALESCVERDRNIAREKVAILLFATIPPEFIMSIKTDSSKSIRKLGID